MNARLRPVLMGPHVKVHATLLSSAFVSLTCGLACSSTNERESETKHLGSVGGKVDGHIATEVAFEIDAATSSGPARLELMFSSWGEFRVTATQSTDAIAEPQRLQLEVESGSMLRRSAKGVAPKMTLGSTNDRETDYTVSILNWGEEPTSGLLGVTTEGLDLAGFDLFFNNPDCTTCLDPAGELRATLVDAIGHARATIDMAIYGFADPAVTKAVCDAIDDGVDVRVVTDDESLEPGPRSYYEHLFGPKGIAKCGAEVVAVMSSSIMHHKFLVIDHGRATERLVMGSANFTPGELDANHNHLLFIDDHHALVDAYQAEFDQLFGRCSIDRLDESTTCDECTPSCVENQSEEGPWDALDGEVSAVFSPSDDTLAVLRGPMTVEKRTTRDTKCDAQSADCFCGKAGTEWSCTYCAAEGDWGLIGEAEENIRMSLFSLTDDCLALGLVRARRRGVEVSSIWDDSTSSNLHSNDEYLCSQGVVTYLAGWGESDPFVFNHNKTIVVDDLVFDGSMNFSERGAALNNENALVWRSPAVASMFATYIDSEIALLEQLGIEPLDKADCGSTSFRKPPQ